MIHRISPESPFVDLLWSKTVPSASCPPPPPLPFFLLLLLNPEGVIGFVGVVDDNQRHAIRLKCRPSIPSMFTVQFESDWLEIRRWRSATRSENTAARRMASCHTSRCLAPGERTFSPDNSPRQFTPDNYHPDNSPSQLGQFPLYRSKSNLKITCMYAHMHTYKYIYIHIYIHAYK